ncbi:MAG: GntR family transcriptional regulator [Kiritimatiellae bacterium]|nr:GntR family transcriptional regulator [Kiritimatiellia bacterium]
MKKPSFKIDRRRHGSYVAQMTDAIKDAIQSGYYKAGDVLPTLEELAEEGGVSLYIPRAAVKRLADEGFVVPRPGVGSVVVAKDAQVWHGHVVIVTSELRDCLYYATIVAVLREELHRANYLVTHVSVPENREIEADFSHLDVVMEHAVNLVVQIGSHRDVAEHIADYGVPFLAWGDEGSATTGAAAYVRDDFDEAYAAFAAHCAEVGVRTVAVVGFGGPCGLLPALRAAGLEAEAWRVPCVKYGEDAIENVQRNTLNYFESILSDSAGKLPDVFCFTDDYAAAGALTALQHHGVRLPDDVRFATHAYVGIGPFYWKPLSRFELDPWESGYNVFAAVMDCLTGKAAAPSVNRAAYVRGETF